LNDAISLVRSELGQMIAHRHRLEKELNLAQTTLKGLSPKIDQAVDGGHDDLARQAIAVRLDVEKRIADLSEDRALADTQILDLEDIITRLKEKAGIEASSSREALNRLNRALENAGGAEKTPTEPS
ncbi:MAG: PspA/IM30 family protein, partial [Pseudomonadota bacterium]